MNFRGLDLNLLVARDALLTERSTTRAGERIFLSQSAMSGALTRLRQFFGDDELLIQWLMAKRWTAASTTTRSPLRRGSSRRERLLVGDDV